MRPSSPWDNEAVSGLPPGVQSLFWDYPEGRVSLDRDRDFVIDRVLSAGEWEAIRWLRREVGGEAIRAYLLRTRGRRLSPRQLRLWQVLLDLPKEEVDGWVNDAARRHWDARAV